MRDGFCRGRSVEGEAHGVGTNVVRISLFMW